MKRRDFLEALGAILFTAKAEAFKSVDASVLSIDASGYEALDEGNVLIPLPSFTCGDREPIKSLAGAWKFTPHRGEVISSTNLDSLTWQEIQLPKEFAMLGIAVAPNQEYLCRKRLQIPENCKGQRIFLRFDGVYSYARVWINGVFLRDHSGGFTSWDCDITDHVTPGHEANLVVGITDRNDDISQGSYYAKHSIAGILRDVRLFIVPQTYLCRYDVTVALDDNYKNGVIRVAAKLSSPEFRSAELKFCVTDVLGKVVNSEPASISLNSHGGTIAESIRVREPLRWDSEHPNLYTLETSLVVDGTVTETLRRRIGFRSVERAGNQVMVNGEPIKLRGVCRHSIHPTFGRAVPTEFDEADAALLRAANINFVRTSHYPPTEQFLDACDKHGIYVEEEAAVCWSAVDNGPSSDSRFTDRFVGQFREMITRDRSHPSVLFWSLGNESHWGENFEAERKIALAEDPGRLTVFSFPDTIPEPSTVDIYSKHYPDVSADLNSQNYPLLNDEFAHVSCYNLDTLRRDPGVRNFWGNSIRAFGEKFLNSEGCLGGSIWAGIDEVFHLPDGPAGYGPWGIIDGWRREKPEYWLTKKAYSPIRLEDRPLPAPKAGEPLVIPITNAFDHTNLSEVDIHWSVGESNNRLGPINIPPHQSGYLVLPPHAWKKNDELSLEFYRRGQLIDRFKLPIDPSPLSLPTPATGRVTVSQSADGVRITGPNVVVDVSYATGLISQATYDNQLLIKGGPYIDFGAGPLVDHWLLKSFEVKQDGNAVCVTTAGECKNGEGIETLPVDFYITIDGAGLIHTQYRFHNDVPAKTPIGISYLLSPKIDKLVWHGKSLWSAYPDDHIGRPKGTARRYPNHQELSYRDRPGWSWSEDVGDFFLWGKKNSCPKASNDFLSLKENIWYASCVLEGTSIRIRAEGNAEHSACVGILPDDRVAFSLYSFRPYPDLEWGNYTGATTAPAVSIREANFRLTNLREEAE